MEVEISRSQLKYAKIRAVNLLPVYSAAILILSQLKILLGLSKLIEGMSLEISESSQEVSSLVVHLIRKDLRR